MVAYDQRKKKYLSWVMICHLTVYRKLNPFFIGYSKSKNLVAHSIPPKTLDCKAGLTHTDF